MRLRSERRTTEFIGRGFAYSGKQKLVLQLDPRLRGCVAVALLALLLLHVYTRNAFRISFYPSWNGDDAPVSFLSSIRVMPCLPPLSLYDYHDQHKASIPLPIICSLPDALDGGESWMLSLIRFRIAPTNPLF